MGKVHERPDDKLIEFFGKQHTFFVGTAPDCPDGHLNVSPKGLNSFRILGPNTVAYLDLTGIETAAQLRQNGRITILFRAFEGRPLIVRPHGRGRVAEPGDPGWDALISHLPEYPGVRSVILMDVERVADSWGFAVPPRVQGRAVPVARLRQQERAGRYGEIQGREEPGEPRGIAGLRSAGGDVR
jgi:hypothetical protein